MINDQPFSSRREQPYRIPYGVLHRPYDIAFSPTMRMEVIERRRHPTGFPIGVKEVLRGKEYIYQYPFSRMELGDFFEVPIGRRSESSMRVAMHQSAHRRDLEIAIHRIPRDDGNYLLCIVTVIGITKWKTKARLEHDASNVRFSQENRHTRKNRDKLRRERKLKSSNNLLPSGRTPMAAKMEEIFTNPSPPLEPEPTPVAQLTRAEIIERSLRLNQ